MQRDRRTALAALIAASAAACSSPPQRHEFRAEQMGTIFRIVLYCADESKAERAARAAFERIAELDAIFSDYKGKSELNRLCRSALHQPTPVSAELWGILDLAEQISKRSEGAFDITVGPLVRLWRRAKRLGRLPAEERRIKALEAVGQHHLRLIRAGHRVELLRPGMHLDLGGIAKGWAAREALAALRRCGIERALVDGGGDLALGAPPWGKDGWTIGLAPPTEPGRPAAPPERALVLSDTAIATSGDAYRFVEIDGVRYSHIVDPRTGLGLTTPSSVTVLAPDAALADALASAVSVLGPEKGLALVAGFPGAEVLIRRIEAGVLRVHASPGFPPTRTRPVR